MAIRFRCVSCSQPIEVDDEWRMKLVACPYCRRTVTAPNESILDDFNAIPTAKPLVEPVQASHWPTGVPPLGPAIAVEQNRPAVVALILSSVAVVFFIIAWMISAAHIAEINEFQVGMRDGTSMMSAMNKIIEKNGGAVPRWMLALGFLQLAGLGAFVAAIVLGILGLRRPWRRGMAIAGLVISGGFIAFLCLGTFVASAAGLLARP